MNLHHFTLQKWFRSIMFLYGMNHSLMKSYQMWLRSGLHSNHDGPPYLNFKVFFSRQFNLSTVEHPHALVDLTNAAMFLLPLFLFSISCIIITLTEMLACSRYFCKSLADTLRFFLQDAHSQEEKPSLSCHRLINIKAFRDAFRTLSSFIQVTNP